MDTRRLHDRFGDANLVDVGETLHAGGDIHVLTKIVDTVVEPDRDGPPSVHTDLEPQRPRGRLVEFGQFLDHLDRGANSVLLTWTPRSFGTTPTPPTIIVLVFTP